MSSASPMPEPTQLQKQFDKHFRKAIGNPLAGDTEFLAAWAKRRNNAATMTGLDDLLRDLGAHDPLRLMEDMKTVVRQLGWLRPGAAARLPRKPAVG